MRFQRILIYLGTTALILLALYLTLPLLIPDLLWGEQITLQIPGDDQHFRICVREAADLVPELQVRTVDSLPPSIIDLTPSPASDLKFGLYRVTRKTSGEVQIDALGPGNLRFFVGRAWKMKAALAALSDAIAKRCVGRDATASPAPGR